MFDVLTERLGAYFRHADPKHDVLDVGDRAIACANIRRALRVLDVQVDAASSDELLFDEGLKAGVKRLQDQFRHRVKDGTVGPGTRRLFVWTLLLRHEPNIFKRFKRPDPKPRVLLSYSHQDEQWVKELHAWLEQEDSLDVEVIRDTTAFRPGASVSANIRAAVAKADSVIVIWSARSQHSDWVALERSFAEEVERGLGSSLLVYVCIDETELPEHDKVRIAIRADRKPFEDVKDEVRRAIGSS